MGQANSRWLLWSTHSTECRSDAPCARQTPSLLGNGLDSQKTPDSTLKAIARDMHHGIGGGYPVREEVELGILAS